MRIAAFGWMGSALALSALTVGVPAGGAEATLLERTTHSERPAGPVSSPVAAAQAASADPGFLFQRPRIGFTIRGGMFFHRADSDIHEFSQERFTIEESDFRGLAGGVEAAAWIGSRTEIALGMDGSRVTLESEYRDWLEEDGSPILQTTRLTHGPAVSLGVRRYLLPRGEQLGQFIWIPGAWNVFVGGGGAVTGYGLVQSGDFVNEDEEIIVTDRLTSEGTTFSPFLMAGAELRLSTRAALVFDGRYEWGRDELGTDFRGFDPMDLSGARFTAGLSYRF